jgi:predicted ATPase/DNA-binding CsgD family transcriptional regulator
MVTPKPGACVNCGTGARGESEAGGVVPRYCSNACRQRAYRWRLKATGLSNSSSASLQAQMNSFVGRVDELVDVARLVREARLVTLTGAPGVGKTRLAGEFAAQEQRGGRCEVVLVELASLTDGQSARQLIRSALRESGEPDGDATAHPGGGNHSRLLVLDNCEHLLDDCCTALIDLLAHHPQVRVLATSREPLRLPGEVVFPVHGLLPLRADLGDSATDVVRVPAVRLFVDRARSVLPEFHLTEENVADVSALCVRLDGLPLAIELAAGLVRAFPVSEIHRRMDERLDLLTGGWRTAEPRHHSLRAAFDWSHSLLATDEQVLFRTLSGLPGGFGTDIATALARDKGISAGCVPNLLVALEAKSLITRVSWTSAAARFQMLESIRCYGREQMVSRGEEQHAQDALVHWLVDTTEGFPDTGILTPRAVGRLTQEEDNLVGGLDWLSTGVDERQLVLAAAADAIAMVQGCPPDHHGRLTRALDKVGAGSDHHWVALATQAVIAAWHGDHRTAARLANEVRCSRAESQHDQMATLLTLVGRTPGSVPTIDELRECLHRSHAGGDTLMASLCLYTVADRLVHHEDAHAGARLIDEALDVLPTENMTGPFRTLLHVAGVLALDAGDLPSAEEHFTKLLRESQHAHHAAMALEGLAVRAVGARRYEHALRLLAASEAMGGSGGFGAADWWRKRVEVAAARARQTLRSTQSGAASAYGQALSPQQAVSYALDSQPTASAKGSTTGETLSEREWEVAVLVSQGLMNRQIAARLYVSVRTVETHVRNIRTALGLNTRSHIAAWTAERRRSVPSVGRAEIPSIAPNRGPASIAV